MPRTLIRASRISLVGLAVIIAVAAALTFILFTNVKRERQLVAHTYEVSDAISHLYADMQSAETGQRGFLLTMNAMFLEPYTKAIDEIPAELDSLARLIADNPEEQQRIVDLRPLIAHKLAEMAQTLEFAKAGDMDASLAIVRDGYGRSLMQQISGITGAMRQAEDRLLEERTQAVDGAQQRALILALLAIGAASIAVATTIVVQVGSVARRLEGERRITAIADQRRTMLDNITQGIAVFSDDQELTVWNRQFVNLLDIPDDLAIPGIPYQRFVELSRSSGERLFVEADDLQTTLFGAGVPLERVRVGGTTLEISYKPIQTGGFVVSYADITERKRNEMLVQQIQKSEAIGQLTGGVAHDFNNLLTIIMGNLDRVQQRLKDQPDIASRVANALSGAERGVRLTRQLLAFARRQPLAPDSFNLNDLVVDVSELLQRTLGEAISIDIVPAGELRSAFADRSEVENVLINLALNARDAMPSGGKLTIETANATLDADYAARNVEVTPGDYVLFAVSDTGSGMSQAVLERAFDPFFTTKREGQGTGLGLSMVYGFSKQSGGHVKIYSELGQGTTVRFYLPKARESASEQPVRQIVEHAVGTETILVVEDDILVREAVVDMLEDLGYRVLTAGDATDGLEMLNKGPPIDLLLTDVVLPGDSGRVLADKARELYPSLKILFTSGYSENAIIHHGRLDEGVHLLSKPYQQIQLSSKVRAVLDS